MSWEGQMSVLFDSPAVFWLLLVLWLFSAVATIVLRKKERRVLLVNTPPGVEPDPRWLNEEGARPYRIARQITFWIWILVSLALVARAIYFVTS